MSTSPLNDASESLWQTPAPLWRLRISPGGAGDLRKAEAARTQQGTFKNFSSQVTTVAEFLHNSVMRKIPIVLAAGVAISGAVLTAFSTPPYPLQMPSIIEHSKGVPINVTVRAWNLRPREATITYLGDCCSLDKSVTLPPFSTQTIEFTLDTSRLPSHSINKTATFSIKSGDVTFVKGVPYYLKAKRS